jgi:hypothetical protein
LIYFPPFLIFTQALVYFSNRILQVPDYFLYMSAATIFAVSMALTGLAIGIGALMPNFKSDHPSKIAVGPGGVLYMLLSFVYIAIMLVIQIRPVWYFVLHRSQQPHDEYYAAARTALRSAACPGSEIESQRILAVGPQAGRPLAADDGGPGVGAPDGGGRLVPEARPVQANRAGPPGG